MLALPCTALHPATGHLGSSRWFITADSLQVTGLVITLGLIVGGDFNLQLAHHKVLLITNLRR